MYPAEAIKKTRLFLSLEKIDAFIIPSNDPHFGEYTQDYYKTREWLSGFTGSAGVLVITHNKAALWTDSRYFVQAANELNGSGIELMKLKMPQTPSISDWIKEQVNNYANSYGKIAIDESLFSYNEFISLQDSLSPYKLEAIYDPFSRLGQEIWINRPPLKFNPIEFMPIERSGEDTISKHKRFLEELNKTLKGKFDSNKEFAYIVSACDQIAWLCNIRGTDIAYNPIVQSYAIINSSGIILFANLNAINSSFTNNKDIKYILKEQNIELADYESFNGYLNNLPDNIQRLYIADTITVRDYLAIKKTSATLIEDKVPGGILANMKSTKNSIEIAGFKQAFLMDGIAWCKLLKYISEYKGSLNEYQIGEKLIAFRKHFEKVYVGESFEPIVAFGASAALPHYSTTKDKCNIITDNNFLLMDTGAQYICGTTDTTRTISIGSLTKEQKKYYTLVLKGMINLSCAKFPAGTRGSQLDILARGPLFNQGVMYFHGTCHGIGHYLCVHEGPQSIRMEENPVTIKPGMVISNEPAIYFDNQWGIRIENVMLVKEWKETEFNKFYEFETLTLVPIETKAVSFDLLSHSEIKWIEEYNSNVYNKLESHLNSDEKKWLQDYISMQ